MNRQTILPSIALTLAARIPCTDPPATSSDKICQSAHGCRIVREMKKKIRRYRPNYYDICISGKEVIMTPEVFAEYYGYSRDELIHVVSLGFVPIIVHPRFDSRKRTNETPRAVIAETKAWVYEHIIRLRVSDYNGKQQ